MANELAKAPSTGSSIASYLSNEAVRGSIEKVVTGKNMDRFVTSIVSAVQANPQLTRCTNQSILSAALMGESLQLPPSPQLGYYYFVGYKNRKKINGQQVEVEEAQFQIGWKGMVQLAIRSGQYKNIVCSVIKEGEVDFYNPITEAIQLTPIMDPAKREAAKTIGYYAGFELVNGFKKELFKPIETILAHAKRWSKSYRYDLNNGTRKSYWSTDFDAMAKKTMLRDLLGKWGLMTVEMQRAYTADQAVIDEDGTARYVDNQNTIEEQVHEDIAANANSKAFEEAEVIDTEVVEASVAPTVEAPQPQPDKPKRGRPPKVQANPEPEKPAMPEPQPQTVTVGEAEVSFAPEWE